MKLPRVLKTAALLACAFAATSYAQYTTTVTASSILSGGTASGGTPMPYGTVCMVPVDANDAPIAVSATGWGLLPAGHKLCGSIVSGAISGGLHVPDASHTNLAAPIHYDVIIQMTDSSGNPQGGASTLHAVDGVTGTTWALDAYAPPVTVTSPSALAGYGSSVPLTCTGPSIWTTPGGSVYSCASGGYVLAAAPGATPATPAYSGQVSAPGGLVSNQEIYALNTSTGTVAAPAQLAGIQSAATGGTVAAGTYACEVTYVGAAGGETTPSTTSGTVTTSGSTSELYCAANDAPAGATGYNVYWQTGGTGNYYLDSTNENVSFLKTGSRSTTPATSGTTPPDANTALAKVSYAQGLLAGAAGQLTIPPSLAASEGNPGDPATGQYIFDARTGAFATRGTVGIPQKSSTGSVMGYQIYVDLSPGQLAAGQQTNAVGASIEQGFTGSPYGLTLPLIPATAAGFFRNYRGGSSNSNAVWAGDFVTYVANQNNIAAGVEIDVLNASGSAATSVNGGDGIGLLSAGASNAWHAIDIQNSGSEWTEGIVFNTGATSGAALEFGPKASGTNQPSQYLQFDSVQSGIQYVTMDEDAFGDLVMSVPNYILSTYVGTPTSPNSIFASPFAWNSDTYNGSGYVGSLWTLGPVGTPSGAVSFETLRLSNTGSPASASQLGFELPNRAIIDAPGTATSSANYYAQGVLISSSEWNGTSAVTSNWEISAAGPGSGTVSYDVLNIHDVGSVAASSNQFVQVPNFVDLGLTTAGIVTNTSAGVFGTISTTGSGSVVLSTGTGVTKTCTAYPTVVGGIVTGC